MSRRICRNRLCQEEFLKPGHVFCPSCRLAIRIGFKHGALVLGPVAALIGFLIGLLQ